MEGVIIILRLLLEVLMKIIYKRYIFMYVNESMHTSITLS